jgi:hypothetical protein
MKILFCTFLSIFAFSSVANATADTENFDSEVTAAFSSSNSTVPQIIPEDYLSRARAALAARLSRIKSDVTEVAEEEKFGKRKREETTTMTRPIPDQAAFSRIVTHTFEYRPCPPAPRAGYREIWDSEKNRYVFIKKEVPILPTIKIPPFPVLVVNH